MAAVVLATPVRYPPNEAYNAGNNTASWLIVPVLRYMLSLRNDINLHRQIQAMTVHCAWAGHAVRQLQQCFQQAGG